jgi:hypothetical protein
MAHDFLCRSICIVKAFNEHEWRQSPLFYSQANQFLNEKVKKNANRVQAIVEQSICRAINDGF